jgi:hypothetical protein
MGKPEFKKHYRKCSICERDFVPSTHNQKYCTNECASHAKKLRSIKRDLNRYVERINRRIDELISI